MLYPLKGIWEGTGVKRKLQFREKNGWMANGVVGPPSLYGAIEEDRGWVVRNNSQEERDEILAMNQVRRG